jgi:hypothetical protein
MISPVRRFTSYLADSTDVFRAAPDRIGKVAKFNAEAYAVLEATPAQSQLLHLVICCIVLSTP